MIRSWEFSFQAKQINTELKDLDTGRCAYCLQRFIWITIVLVSQTNEQVLGAIEYCWSLLKLSWQSFARICKQN